MPEVPSVDSPSPMSDILDAVYPRAANPNEAEQFASDDGERI